MQMSSRSLHPRIYEPGTRTQGPKAAGPGPGPGRAQPLLGPVSGSNMNRPQVLLATRRQDFFCLWHAFFKKCQC